MREHEECLFHGHEHEQDGLLTPRESCEIGWMGLTVLSTPLGPEAAVGTRRPKLEDTAPLLGA